MQIRINVDSTAGIRALRLKVIAGPLTTANGNATADVNYDATCAAEATQVIFTAGAAALFTGGTAIPATGIPTGNYDLYYAENPTTPDWQPFISGMSIINNDTGTLLSSVRDEYDAHVAGTADKHAIAAITGLQTKLDAIDTVDDAQDTSITAIEEDIEDLQDIQDLFKPTWHTGLYPAVLMGGKQSVSDRVGLQMSFDTEDDGFFRWVVQYRWYENDATAFGDWEEIVSLVDNVFIDKPAITSELWGQVEPGLPKTALLQVRARGETLFGTTSLTTICEITAIEAFGEASVNQIVTKAILSDDYLTQVVENITKGSLTNMVKVTLTVGSGGMVKVNSVWYESGTHITYVERNSTVNLKASAAVTWTINGEPAGEDLTTAIDNIASDTTVAAEF